MTKGHRVRKEYQGKKWCKKCVVHLCGFRFWLWVTTFSPFLIQWLMFVTIIVRLSIVVTCDVAPCTVVPSSVALKFRRPQVKFCCPEIRFYRPQHKFASSPTFDLNWTTLDVGNHPVSFQSNDNSQSKRGKCSEANEKSKFKPSRPLFCVVSLSYHRVK